MTLVAQYLALSKKKSLYIEINISCYMYFTQDKNLKLRVKAQPKGSILDRNRICRRYKQAEKKLD
jgi:hypothetical protein